MITEEERRQLNESAVEVFGTMYFTPVELLDEVPSKETWKLEDRYVKTAISYSGPKSARVTFYFPRSLAVNIAGGFLGVDEDKLTTGQVVDTMQESANMIIGSFLGRIDPDGACALGIPAAAEVEGFSPDSVAADGDDLLAFISDFGYVWLLFQS